MSRKDWIGLVVDEIVRQTDKAFLCVIDEEQHWIPFSQIDLPDSFEVGEMDCEMYVSRWFAEKEGLV